MDAVVRTSRKARIVFAMLAILMLVAILFGKPLLDSVGRWLSEDPSQTLERFDIFVAWIAIFSMPLLIAGILTYKSGYRAVALERFPPAGAWVVVDTPVETGSRARFRGRLLQLGGVLICAMAIGFPIALWYIVHSIAGVA